MFTDILLQNVKVLAVDQRYVRSTSAKPARAVTLEVDQIQAQKLVLAASVGKLSLTLKNSPAAKSPQPRRISLDDLPNSAKPQAVPTQLVSEKDNKPADPVVTIVRGADKRESYRVPDERTISAGIEDSLRLGRGRIGRTQHAVPKCQPRDARALVTATADRLAHPMESRHRERGQSPEEKGKPGTACCSVAAIAPGTANGIAHLA